jgi:hypothetical protein
VRPPIDHTSDHVPGPTGFRVRARLGEAWALRSSPEAHDGWAQHHERCLDSKEAARWLCEVDEYLAREHLRAFGTCDPDSYDAFVVGVDDSGAPRPATDADRYTVGWWLESSPAVECYLVGPLDDAPGTEILLPDEVTLAPSLGFMVHFETESDDLPGTIVSHAKLCDRLGAIPTGRMYRTAVRLVVRARLKERGVAPEDLEERHRAGVEAWLASDARVKRYSVGRLNHYPLPDRPEEPGVVEAKQPGFEVKLDRPGAPKGESDEEFIERYASELACRGLCTGGLGGVRGIWHWVTAGRPVWESDRRAVEAWLRGLPGVASLSVGPIVPDSEAPDFFAGLDVGRLARVPEPGE